MSKTTPQPHPSIHNPISAFEIQKSSQEYPLSPTLEDRSALHKRPPPLRRRLRLRGPAPTPRSSAQYGAREAFATDGADSRVPSTGEESGEWTGSEEIHRQSPYPTATTGLLKAGDLNKGKTEGKAKGKGRADARKPWDPPFGRRREGRGQKEMGERQMGGDKWFGSSPAPLKKTGRDMEAKGVARRLFPVDDKGEYSYDHEPHDGLLELHLEDMPRLTSTPPPAPATKNCASVDATKSAPAKKKSKRIPGLISAIWICVGVFTVLVSILIFAVLIAHCLAWFLIYKTEARLGEARRGIMQGGEMRLCLCAA
ncbi:hypothetical protein AA0114_g12010 [Alternaria tenuissima]|uniref:Uncharacterized protein n=1 Tax=Alternaria tenuissima TaxID=119927 RepID=A0A4V1WL56_9PLEO|nr:hypothetical protein AA0114_g12010 [Alternaria tenuissima]